MLPIFLPVIVIVVLYVYVYVCVNLYVTCLNNLVPAFGRSEKRSADPTTGRYTRQRLQFYAGAWQRQFRKGNEQKNPSFLLASIISLALS